MQNKPFYLFIFIFQNTGAQADEVCGEVALTYFLRENRIAARLTFVPSTELAWYRWVHFFIESGPQPDFDFQDALRMNSSKYEKHNFSIIIKDLQASDNGLYNIECKNVNGRHLFSGKLIINKPYVLETTPITPTLLVDSVPKHSDKAYRDADLIPMAENCNFCKTITDNDGTLTTDKVHTTHTDSQKNQTADVILTEIRLSTITEETTSAKEHKLLTKVSIFLAIGCTTAGVLLTLVVVFVVNKILSHKRSNKEINSRMTDGYDQTTMKEQTKENVNCTVIDETKRELRTFSDSRSSTQGPYSTLTFINASNENEYAELEEQPAENEYTNV